LKNQSNKYLIYTTLKNVENMNIPGPLQNLYLRQYCENNKINFMLPVEDYIYDSCYIELFNLLDVVKKDYNGIITFSIKYLPFEYKLRQKILKSMITLGKEMIFVYEKIKVNKLDDIDYIETILKLNNNNKNSIQTEKKLIYEYFNWR